MTKFPNLPHKEDDDDKTRMTPQEVIDFCIWMHNKAHRSRGIAKRSSYSQTEREQAVGVLQRIIAAGGDRHIAASMMAMNLSTLDNWVDKATAPQSEWTIMHYKTADDIDVQRYLNNANLEGLEDDEGG